MADGSRYCHRTRTQRGPAACPGPHRPLSPIASTSFAHRPPRASGVMHAACARWPIGTASSTAVGSRSGCSCARGSIIELAAAGGGSPSPEVLRAKHDALAKELAGLQASLKRIDVAAAPARAGDHLPGQRRRPGLRALAERRGPLAGINLAEDHPGPGGERQRLAEEVHDGPAQVLTNAIFQVEYLDRVIDDSPDTARAELAFLRTMLREGLDEVRSFITALRPPSVDVGLGQAITAAGAEFASKHGIAVEVAVPGIDARVPNEAKAPIAARRAGGAPERPQARGRDRGPHRARSRPPRSSPTTAEASTSCALPPATRNFGLQFMRERAELMGSSLQIESRQGEGTRILLRIPEVR